VLKAKKKSKPFHGYNPNKHSRKGGLNAKGRAAAKRKTGANLKPPVTTKPSKLKPGGKKAKRRKSFCARMSGVREVKRVQRMLLYNNRFVPFRFL
jgi:hypothetical protein